MQNVEQEWKDAVLHIHPTWLILRTWLDAMWERGLSIEDAVCEIEKPENSTMIMRPQPVIPEA